LQDPLDCPLLLPGDVGDVACGGVGISGGGPEGHGGKGP
jgi:hypothetical protein